MTLTDSEKEEFLALANETLDPEIWLEEDLPILRAAQREYEEAQARERDDVRPSADEE
jgi:hypothetical protein